MPLTLSDALFNSGLRLEAAYNFTCCVHWGQKSLPWRVILQLNDNMLYKFRATVIMTTTNL